MFFSSPRHLRPATMSATFAPSASNSPLPPSYSDPMPPPFDPTSSTSSSTFDFDALSPEFPPDTSPLPAYTPGPNHAASLRSRNSTSRPTTQPKEFYYELKKRGKPFACLTLTAYGGAAFSKHMPTFVEGEKVKGRVELRLERPESVLGVYVQIQGQVITGANPNDQLTFIDLTHTLWGPSMGDPRGTTDDAGGTGSARASTSVDGTPSGSNDSSNTPVSSSPDSSALTAASADTPPVQAAPTGLPPKFTDKLQGTYTWSFALDLPKEVVVPYGARGEVGVFHPPQTFNERHSRASVVYEIVLRVGRGRLLRGDHRIPAQFGYIPVTRPPAFSQLRRMAYAEGSALLGPTVDVEGWYAPEEVRVQGKVLHNRTVDIGFSTSPMI
ncbi:unnamed protein product [Cyclocybe aegerita]|uniref:Arrestin-like N-terminal domain-containing protein n=1 Tax=Cyclocybe aegerita TaxID=1973307 RepID=A0A8S0WP05_CYCAE|nr:unnamed protein product [Cyclocybe aegerita]